MKSIQKTITKKLIQHSPYLVLAGIIAFLDQWSKMYVSGNFQIGESVNVIDGFLKMTYVHNKGAAFSFGSMFSDSVRLIIFKILPVFVGGYLLKLIFSEKENTLMKWAYTFVLGGGIGNVTDRIRLDYVVDFISVYHTGFSFLGFDLEPWYFAIFNLADSAVTLAAILIIIDYFLNKKKTKNDKKSELS